MSRFTEVLTVSPLSDGKTWITRRAFGYDVGAEGSGNTVEVPVGFMTDFASVPRLFWIVLPRWGKYGNAAVIHDYCYWDQARSRRESDNIFYEAMGVLGVSSNTRHVMYWAVKYFGGGAWKSNQNKKAKNVNKFAGDRTIKSFARPEDLRAEKLAA
jgi:hypothetical protein